MATNPEVTITSETWRHIKSGEFDQATDVLRHEGLKKVVEAGLYYAGSSALGRLSLRAFAGAEVAEPVLKTYVSELNLNGPVGIAPGWDKTGKTLHGWQALGARHIAVGGIPPFQQFGRAMPRLRTMDQQIGDHGTSKSLNSFGFWSIGADKVVYNIERQKEMSPINIPIIAQITLNKEFYEGNDLDLIGKMVALTVRKVLPIADAINIGLTSPNTQGMRAAQDAGDRFLLSVVYAAKTEMQRLGRIVPIIFKGDGDGGEERLEMYCKWAEYREEAIDAFELINTTALPHIKARYGAEVLPGGLAGADEEYQQMALDAVRYVYEAVGDRMDIIATGGCNSGEQAFKFIKAGASAVGINTGIRQLGIRAPRIIEKDLLSLIKADYSDAPSLDRVIGADTRRGAKYLTREAVADKVANVARRQEAGTQSTRDT
jgi:dihydroorotate dehydrogenase